VDDEITDPLSEGAGEVVEDAPRPYQTKVAPPVPAAPPFDMQAFAATLAQAMAAAMAQSGQMSAQMTQDVVTAALQQARTKIPENETHPMMSAFNPRGDRDYPRPGLRCPMFLGQYDEDGKVVPAFEIAEDRCTVDEQIALNQVRQGVYDFVRNDNKRGRVVVQERRDENGEPRRLVIAFPHGWLGKDQHQFLPSQTRIAEQLTAAG